MNLVHNPAADAFRPFSEPTKRKLTIADLIIPGIALSALFVSAKYHEYRIKWDVGITNSRFADSNGASAAARTRMLLSPNSHLRTGTACCRASYGPR